MIEDIVKNLEPVLGQKLVMMRVKGDELWFIFEGDDIVKIVFPSVELSCVGCEEKKELKT